MILFELKAIGVNLLFGSFFYIMINTLCFYEVKANKIFVNFLYFVLTIIWGLLYIIYLDYFIFKFNLYFVLFIVLGYFITSRIKWFNLNSKLVIFNYFINLNFKIIKKVFLFLINYSFWKKLNTIIKNKR